MPFNKISSLSFMTGLTLLVMGFGLLWATPQTVEAQCGSQASSCKNCHEVQGELPVNNDGNGWHESHAFGDFCYMCHAGNPQATEIDAAHTGMVAPLSDVNAACQQCHAADLDERAQVYAALLNVDLNSGDGGSTSTDISGGTTETTEETTTSAEQPASETSVVQPSASTTVFETELVVDDPNMIDYVARYDEIVLGIRPTNWGNVILSVMIGLLVVAGGGFVLINEIRLNTRLGDTQPVDGEYPSDVVEMLPALASLKIQTRNALRKVLTHPHKADKVLGLIDEVVSEEGDK